MLRSSQNLGHKKYPHVEGLTVTLHEYQKQAVGFMLERENGDNRMQVWAKLPPCPGEGGTKDTLYFSPILGSFSTKPERIGRGGFLCEEMGLGKTVISLAVILSNPAPPLPLSGTQVSGDNAHVTEKGWSVMKKKSAIRPDFDELTAGLFGDTNEVISDGTGSFFHTGTLVVCHVSLVGQWVEEAKKKLKDPGLVYPYHGSSRTKDAAKLCEKSIIVTTYATLSSDDNYHRKKHKGNKPYVPICGMMRWWRVILDESHAMKSNNTNHSRAIKSLVAENKWCVTGTPFNNNISDISNQMSFLEMPPFTNGSIFRTVFAAPFDGKALTRRNQGEIVLRGVLPKFALFLSLMRNFMMRHSKDQRSVETKLGIVSLPPKIQKSIMIDFGSEEQRIYEDMENAAKLVYMRYRQAVMKNTLYLLSTMTPLRDVCSGGALPTQGGDRHKASEQQEIFGAISKSWVSNPPYQMTDRDTNDCAICLDVLDEPVAVDCSNTRPHIFCRECIEGIIVAEDSKEGYCPLCRQDIKLKNFRKVLLPVGDCVKEEKAEDGILLRGGLSLAGLKDHGSGFQFDSKLKVLISELKRIAKDEPKSKSLIFSQFVSTLAWLKIELPRHGFQFRTLEGNMSR